MDSIQSMAYFAYYCCYSTNKTVEAHEAFGIELDWAQESILDILRDDHDFFGLTDDSGTSLQFYRTGDSVLMEIPVPAEKGSYGKTISVEEVAPIIKSLPSTIQMENFVDLNFEA